MENDIKIPMSTYTCQPSTSQETINHQNDNESKSTKNKEKPEKKKKWTIPEKVALLTGLERYGPNNIEQISQMIPSQTPATIKKFIDYYMFKTKYGDNLKDNTLDEWLLSGYFEEENTMVPEALLFMHLFEEHPPPEETAGCDVKEIYKFMYYCSLREIPNQLTDMTAIMFKELMQVTDRQIWPWKEREVLEYIVMNVGKKKPSKDYTRETHIESSEDSDDNA